MKKIIAVVLVLTLLLSVQAAAFAAAYGTNSEARKGVARVYAEFDITLGDLVIDRAWCTGSAFAVGKNKEPVSYFVTNRHVVEIPESDIYGVKLSGYYIILDDSGTKFPVDLVTDNNGGADLAVLKLRAPTSLREPCVLHTYSDSSDLLGSRVSSIGYPGISDEITDSTELLSGIDKVTIGSGVFSKVIDDSVSVFGGEVIQTDTSMNHGNSGGPLVDEKGAVLGVCTYGITNTDTELIQGMNFAVSVNEVVKLLDKFSVPYMTVSDRGTNWYIYAILGAAIVAVLAVLVIVLKDRRKPEPKPVPGPAPEPDPVPMPDRPTGRILVCVEGPLAGKRFQLTKNGTLNIGRDSAKCQVVLPENTQDVSRIHCSISFDGTKATITDLKSTNGTYVNSKKLQPGIPVHLHRGLAIDVGSEKNKFVLQ